MERCQDEHTPTVAKKRSGERKRGGGDGKWKKLRFSNTIGMYVGGSEEKKKRNSREFCLTDRG